MKVLLNSRFAKMPTRKNPQDAGLDIYSAVGRYIPPYGRSKRFLQILA